MTTKHEGYLLIIKRNKDPSRPFLYYTSYVII